ncbi:UNVERIFIED_CONTAM: hypothetical protein FKN15_046903 [Acipenser sinensis]
MVRVGTDGTRCSVPAGPLDASGRTTLVRILDAGDGSLPSKVTGLPGLHEGGTEKLGLVGFPLVDSTIVALVKAPTVGGLARDPACPNPQCREMHLKSVYAAETQHANLWWEPEVPDVDKAALLDVPTSPGHTFGQLTSRVGEVEPLASSSDVDCHQDSSSPHSSSG